MPRLRRGIGYPLLVATVAGLLAACGLSASDSPTAELAVPSEPTSPAATAEVGVDQGLGTPPPRLPPDASALPSTIPGSPPPAAPESAPIGFALHVPILMYHRVIPLALAGDSLRSLIVPPGLFSAQMAELHRAGWHTVTVAQLFAALKAGRPEPLRTFAISFDDGYDDGYTYALPILRANGFTATYFVIPSRIEMSGKFLSAQHLRALAAAGMEIGDHTEDHVEVTLLNAAQLHYEVMAAASSIHALVGKWPVSFAYPMGRYDEAAVEELARDGFGIAVTTHTGALETWTDRLFVPRIRVGLGTSPAGLLAELRRREGF